MKQVIVTTENESYPIYIQQDLLQIPTIFNKHIGSDQVFIITNTTLKSLYLSSVIRSLTAFTVDTFVMEDGEQFKSLATFEKIMEQLIRKGYRRNATIIALGGGVVGDLAGFSAACYQRGIPFLQVPTTLLAMVDSSVGGKTAVNHPLAKNMIGAFYQPKAVVADISVLETLPEREFSAGMAEVIKYGLIYDFSFFEYLEREKGQLLERDKETLATVVARCCEIKAEVVSQDEKEAGIRAILNLGHTFGHAIEKAGNYVEYNHGEAVAMGTCMAFQLALEQQLITSEYFLRTRRLFEYFGLPTRAPTEYKADYLLSVMRHDKKNLTSSIRLVVPVGEGKVTITDKYDDRKIISAISSCYRE